MARSHKKFYKHALTLSLMQSDKETHNTQKKEFSTEDSSELDQPDYPKGNALADVSYYPQPKLQNSGQTSGTRAVATTAGRIPLDHESRVGDTPRHRMHTSGFFDFSSHKVFAQTRIYTTRWDGFTGGVSVILLNRDERAVGWTPLLRYGVAGTAEVWASHDRTVPWEATIPQEHVDEAEYGVVAHEWAPKPIDQIIHNWVGTVEPIVTLAERIAKLGGSLSGKSQKQS